MKRFTKAVKMAAAMLSLCLVCVLGVTAEAAKYQPNVTYINPQVNSKDEFYSPSKMRMSTYSDEEVMVIYPKDATLEVSTNKKALTATVVERVNDDADDYVGKRVYVTPNVQKVYDDKNDENLYYDATTGRFYYVDYYYDWDDDNNFVRVEEKQYPTTIDISIKKVGSDYNYYTYCYYDAVTNTYYYYDWDDNDDEQKVTLTMDAVNWNYYYADPTTGIEYYLYKSNIGYYYRDYSVYVYENEAQIETYTDGVTPDYEYAVAWVRLDSTKKGTYKLNVTVNGVKKTLTVYVTPYGDRTYTSVKLGGDTVSSINKKETAKNTTTTTTNNYQVKSSLTSAKLSLKANKGMKITGIVTASLDKNGKVVYKKTKNNKTIKLSQAYTYDYTSAEGAYSKSRSEKKETFVFVSYKDTYLKTSITYSVVKKHGVKQIKEVYKATDGKKYVNYYDFGESHAYVDNLEYGYVPSSVITLWSY